MKLLKIKIDKEKELIDEIMQKRTYFRNKNREIYHKRKEAGTLKKQPSKTNTDYIYKRKNVKEAPTIDDIEKLKYIKPKQKLVKVDMVKYEIFQNIKNSQSLKN